MRFDDEITINAPAAAVWDIYTDVERWPEWTASIRELRYVEGDALEVGARVHIAQPKMRANDWEVSNVAPGRSWQWQMKGPGVRAVASHELEAVDANTTRVRQSIDMQGPLAGIIGRAYARLSNKYLAMEAAGLKQRCEARATA